METFGCKIHVFPFSQSDHEKYSDMETSGNYIPVYIMMTLLYLGICMHY